ncbi:DUF302 domain-containing protein [Maritimibacter sp. DP1N21-5]|uniref:DUF302 domain-containing protein n=1 Tax=Maritimibacter sp. DP1N21-5 TaxID=2836867 RepID=UPI001C445004|nr:DUF302 domain-containing protein [Maritimibacter sp. DP1N21-5]MBV7409600.1 DUF302 domain-containing protein [Maritimibacter sp. DP1N21-5]
MKHLCAIAATVAALSLGAGAALAESHGDDMIVSHAYDGSFDDAAFALENAIVGQGLVIDYVTHTGEMLNRTGLDVGSEVALFEAADVYLFCSAVVSREVMEADWRNIAFCPYGIFVAERDGEVTLGYQNYPEGPMDAVEALLETIVQEVLAN